MTKEEKIKKLEKRIFDLNTEVDYNNAMQLALKLIMNGEYGSLATRYFILFHPKVAGTITAEGRQLTKKMDNLNEDYWYNQWHLEERLHKRLVIKNVEQISDKEPVSIYGDSTSFVLGDANYSVLGTSSLGDAGGEWSEQYEKVYWS